MSRTGLFHDHPENVARAIELRKAGKGYSEIARAFGCHHTTILYLLREFHLTDTYANSTKLRYPIPVFKPARTYADYLREYNLKHPKLTAEERKQIKERLRREIAEHKKVL